MSLRDMRKVIGAVPMFRLKRLCYLLIFQVCKFPASDDREWRYFLISRKWVRIDEGLATRL
jgi:hypothetical protein